MTLAMDPSDPPPPPPGRQLRDAHPDWHTEANCLGAEAASFEFETCDVRAAATSDGGETDDEFVVL